MFYQPKEAVLAGAEYLDSAVPGWADKIDPEKLDVGYPRDCILGQLFGWYIDGRRALGMDREAARKFGFDVNRGALPWQTVDQRYRRLNRHWREAIRLRLGAA